MSSPLSESELCSRLGENYDCHASNFSGGVFLEVFPRAPSGSMAAMAQTCSSFILLPAENTWHYAARAFLYFLGMAYCFIGFAAITACFMNAMETIVQKTKKVTKWDPVEDREVTTEERTWNATFADITLLALGTCAPQIALAWIDAIQLLGKDQSEGLGAGTIIGSAAFDFFPITAVIVLVPKLGQVKKIENYGVFLVELIWSVWAYFWVLIVLKLSSPNVVTLWEAVVTLLQMPLLVLHAYGCDQGWPLFRLPFSPERSEVVEGREKARERQNGGEGTSPRSILPKPQEVVKHWHKFRGSTARYLVQATTSVTAERRPSVDFGQSVSGRIKKQLLSGLTLRRRLQSRKLLAKPIQERDENQPVVNAGNEIRRRSFDQTFPEKDLDDYLDGLSVSQVDDEIISSPDSTIHGPSTSSLTIEVAESEPEKPNTMKLWKSQIIDALSVKGSSDDNGRELLPGALDFVMHPLTLPWKTLFAILVPPATVGGGWVAFFLSIVCITGIAALLIELANLFGCVTGANSLVIAITLLASGTSFPGLIASWIAADHEGTADSAVANINASNSINVFIGLGIPWFMSVLYNKISLGREFETPGGDLTFSLLAYFGTLALGVALLIWRRRVFGGELGGSRFWAWFACLFSMLLWFIFLFLTSFKAYKKM